MKQLLYILKREHRLFKSNKVMVSLFFGAPILLGFVYGLVYQRGQLTDLPIMVIDKDHSSTSASLVDMLEENDMLTVKYVNAENIDIRDKLITERLYAAVLIPPHFEDDLLQRRYTEVTSYINNTNLLPGNIVARSINTVIASLNAAISNKAGKPAAIRWNVFRLFNTSANYLTYIWPSFLAIFLQAVLLLVTAMSFAGENEQGTWRELKELKQPAIVVMTGKISLYCLLTILALGVYAFYFSFFLQSLPQHLPDTLLLLFLYILSLSFQGMIAGLLIKSQLQAVQFLIILNLPIWITSGYSWPFDQSSIPAQIYGVIFPFMPFINGFRILQIEHGTLNDIRHFIQLQLIQFVLYFSLAILLLKYRLKNSSL